MSSPTADRVRADLAKVRESELALARALVILKRGRGTVMEPRLAETVERRRAEALAAADRADELMALAEGTCKPTRVDAARLHFVMGLTEREVAEELHFSLRYVQVMCAEVVDAIAEALDARSQPEVV